jgi:hypothetical protein
MNQMKIKTNNSSLILVNKITEKYSEWLENAGEKAPVLLIGILAEMLIIEQDNTKYYKKLWENCNGKN